MTFKDEKSIPQETTLVDVTITFIKFIIGIRYYLIIGTFLGLVAGISLFFFLPKDYKSRMTAYTLNLTAEEVTDLVNDLALAVLEKDIALISKMTGIKEANATKIRSIKCSPQLDVESDNFDLKEKPHEVFVVTAVCSDKDFLDSIQKGVIYYIENNPYVKQRIETARNQARLNITEIDKEITDLHKLKNNLNKLVFSSGRGGSNMFFSDLSTVSSKIIELTEKRNSFLRELELTNEVNVIKDVVKFKKQASPRLIMSVVPMVIVFNLLMLLIFFGKWVKERI